MLSTGCLAVGDNAIEELFVLAAEIGSERISVLISPKDFRYRPLELLSPETPTWGFELHQQIAANLESFPLSGR